VHTSHRIATLLYVRLRATADGQIRTDPFGRSSSSLHKQMIHNVPFSSWFIIIIIICVCVCLQLKCE
jgi:hypothetical protein